MAETEIHYIVRDAPNHQKDYEAILVSIGKYQDEVSFHVPHTTEIHQDGNVVQIKFRRDLRDMAAHNTAHLTGIQSATEEVRAGIERHFPESDRERLSRCFAGNVIRKADDVYVEE